MQTDLYERYPQLQICRKEIDQAYNLLKKCFEQGNKLLICGNGGSAADADHISAELLKGFCSSRKLTPEQQKQFGEVLSLDLQRALPTIPLTAFNALSSAYINDQNADFIFAQLVFALGRPKDVLWCISTSGSSTNILIAAQVAKRLGISVLGLSGETGGNLKNHCGVCICAPEKETYKIQELHLPIYHFLCQRLEAHFFP